MPLDRILDDTQTVADRLNKNLWMDVVLEILNVADDTDLLPDNTLKGRQSLIHALKAVSTQRAEAFVNEDGVGTEIAAVEATETEGERKRCHEAFTSAECVGWSRGLILLLVLHQNN